jgi:hypothetical protein
MERTVMGKVGGIGVQMMDTIPLLPHPIPPIAPLTHPPLVIRSSVAAPTEFDEVERECQSCNHGKGWGHEEGHEREHSRQTVGADGSGCWLHWVLMAVGAGCSEMPRRCSR